VPRTIFWVTPHLEIGIGLDHRVTLKGITPNLELRISLHQSYKISSCWILTYLFILRRYKKFSNALVSITSSWITPTTKDKNRLLPSCNLIQVSNFTFIDEIVSPSKFGNSLTYMCHAQFLYDSRITDEIRSASEPESGTIFQFQHCKNSNFPNRL